MMAITMPATTNTTSTTCIHSHQGGRFRTRAGGLVDDGLAQRDGHRVRARVGL